MVEGLSIQGSTHSELEHANHESGNSRWLKRLIIGGGIVTAAVIIAPHLLPQLGVGELAFEKALSNCTDNLSSGGIAGFVSNSFLSLKDVGLPALGTALAEGGVANAVATGVIGIGGALLSHYVHKKEDGSNQIRWGNVIKTAALLTSACIALPAILPALGMGITYLAAVIPGISASAVGAFALSTLGTTAVGPSSLAGGYNIGALIVPHLFTCGLSFGSAALALFSGSQLDKKLTHETQAIENTTAVQASHSHAEKVLQRRATPLPALERA